MAAGPIHMTSQTLPSGSVKLLPYMTPWSCGGCHGFPPAAMARATMSSTSFRLLAYRKFCTEGSRLGISALPGT